MLLCEALIIDDVGIFPCFMCSLVFRRYSSYRIRQCTPKTPGIYSHTMLKCVDLPSTQEIRKYQWSRKTRETLGSEEGKPYVSTLQRPLRPWRVESKRPLPRSSVVVVCSSTHRHRRGFNNSEVEYNLRRRNK